MRQRIHQPPRRLDHAARHGMTLRTYCAGCDRFGTVAADAICRAFHAWTIDELQRAGVLGCGVCRSPASLALVGRFWGERADFETWPADAPGWVRGRDDGLHE